MNKNLYKKMMDEDVSNEDFKHIRDICEDVGRTMCTKGYGIGECGYYFKENISELVEFNGLGEEKAKDLMNKAEQFANELVDVGLLE